MSNVAARLIATLRGIADEDAPNAEAAAAATADVEMTAEDVDADPAGELTSSAEAAADGEEDAPLLPDAETSARLQLVDPEYVVVARRPR